MSADRASYLDSSAIVKLIVAEPESAALRTYLRRRKPWLSSALARAEVIRAVLTAGPDAVKRGEAILSRIELIRVNDRVLDAAGRMLPIELRSLDAVHLATAQLMGEDLARLITYDVRMAEAARRFGWTVASPA
jgi:predicted nucleic acid-binding protein